jgi:DNA/RNA-binding domain of Phe-tRNA-synthetase-like protein
MSLTLVVAPHPLLEVGAFSTKLAGPLATLSTPDEIAALMTADAKPAMTSSDEIRAQVRQLLRRGGFRPSGRSKPAAEYLTAAHAEGRFPRINAAVDACNVASLRSGLPISLIDLDRAEGALAIRTCPGGTSYVFNPSGQVLDASGLLAVYDAHGPTGTPVKDAQRTKTHDGTTRTLSIVWGTCAVPGRTKHATAWYRELVSAIAGATSDDVAIETAG